jgi:hypothetical protein
MTRKQPFDSETVATLRVIFDEAYGAIPETNVIRNCFRTSQF